MPKYNGVGIPYFDVAFAASGIVASVPDAPQVDGSMSYTQGFTTPYELPPSDPSYLPVPLNQTNQLFNDINVLLKYLGQNGAPPFITTTMNGGINPYSYNLGAIVSYDAGSGLENWVSTAASNTTTPGAGGALWLPIVGSRAPLLADTSFYVATTGNDSTGAGTSGSPWATVGRALVYIASSIDLAGYVATIQVADGTYAGSVGFSGQFVGAQSSGGVVVNGNSGTPSNVVFSTGFAISNRAIVTVQNMKFTNAGASCLQADQGGIIHIGAGVILGACMNSHLLTTNQGAIYIDQNYTVNGSASTHCSSDTGGLIANSASSTVTLSGTPAFSSGFATATLNGVLSLVGLTYSGSATGSRYQATLNGVIFTNGGGANYFPGNSAGTTATGGQYA